MKKIFLFMILMSFPYWFVIAKAELPYLVPTCPNTNTLAETSINNKDELLIKLNELIRVAYPDEKFNEWNVLEVKPLSKVSRSKYDKAYYRMAKKLCNKEVADNSWLVEFEIPELLPSASAATRVMFVAKDRETGWFVWYTYR